MDYIIFHLHSHSRVESVFLFKDPSMWWHCSSHNPDVNDLDNPSPSDPEFLPTEPYYFASVFHNGTFTTLFTSVERFVNLILNIGLSYYFNILEQNTLNYVQQIFTSSTDPNVIMDSLGTVF